jgi:dihydrofolate reductase
MRKVIAAINMTLDGFCDHTAVTADEELHQHYADLLADAGALIYGRITYQLMESYWPGVVKNPTGEKSTDDFAIAIEKAHKIVFSRTLNNIGWKNATLAKRGVQEEVLALKQQPGKDIFVGSPSLIVQLLKLNLVDQYQLTVHPVIAGKGLPLFKEVNNRVVLKLLKIKKFEAGAITLYYEPAKG